MFAFLVFFLPFQEETRHFRRELEEKRAVIENNLLTGRQHLSSADFAAVFSDASTESGGEGNRRQPRFSTKQ